MRRLAALVLLLAACGGGTTGPIAPAVGGTSVACNDLFCTNYPEGWESEIGATFLSFTNPVDPALAATVGGVDMAGMVAAAGGTWPASPEAAVRAFWQLLGDGQDAELDTIAALGDGTVRSSGTIEGVHMWHRLIPIVDGPAAVGVELRAPNETWETHADVVLDGLRRVEP